MKKDPLASIIIPCRNEEKFIAQCLDSLIISDYPKDRMEIIVINGDSEDKTKEIVQKYVDKYSFIKLFDNIKKLTPISLNMGIKNSKGDVIMMMGAHANYNKDYVSKCIRSLFEFKVDGVGGAMKAIPRENTLIAKAITKVSSSLFGTGDAYFRINCKKVKYVDALFGSCYRRDVFEKIGLYNENFARSQDIEFSLRLKRAGGKILLIPDIVSYYYPSSSLREFSYHNFIDGLWITYPLKFSKTSFSLRHYVPLVFILSLLGTAFLGLFFSSFLQLFLLMVGLYVLTNLYFSIRISLKEKDIKLLFILPLIFTIRHIGYGLGSIFGLLKIIWKKT